MDTGLQDRVRFDDPIVGQLRGREVRFHGAPPSAGVAAAWFEVDMAENISGSHGWHQNGHGLSLRRQNSRPASTGLGWKRRISLLIAHFERQEGRSPPLSCREERDATTPLVYRYRPSGGQVRRVETRHLRRGSERRSLRDTGQFAARPRSRFSSLTSLSCSCRRSSALPGEIGNRTYITSARQMMSRLVPTWRKGSASSFRQGSSQTHRADTAFHRGRRGHLTGNAMALSELSEITESSGIQGVPE